MISAVVLLLAGLAIYPGLTAHQALGRNRNRTAAAALPSRTEERMRSMDAWRSRRLLRTPYVQTMNVGGLIIR